MRYVFKETLKFGFHSVVIALYLCDGGKSRPTSLLTCRSVVNIVQLLNLLLQGEVLVGRKCLSQANVSILL
jgi:hypothetical protein